VVTGAECEVYPIINWGDETQPIYKRDWCHLLVLGVEKIPEHKEAMNLDEVEQFINDVHEQGGIVVMSHPCFSKMVFFVLADMLDGFEILNRDEYGFEEGVKFCEKYNIPYKTYKNSDYHYYNYSFDAKNNPTPINIGSANDMYVKQSGTTLWDSISGTVNGLTNTDLSTVSGMAGQVSSMMDIFTQPVKSLFTGVPELYGLIILGFGLALVKFVLGR
jgi:hypothetical protein